MLSEIRVGKFTSSQIYKLMSVLKNGKPSQTKLTYLEEVQIEAKLERTLNSVSFARPTLWGQLLESRVAGMLGEFEYNYCSDKTLIHPTIPCWAGTPDLVGKDKVGDIKCPYTLKAFAQLSDICLKKDPDELKKAFPAYYWQLVSNGILTGKSKGELLVYCPYKSELDSIREHINQLNDEITQTKLQWVFFSSDEDLPYLKDGGYYKNLNRFTFDIPGEDVTKLIEEVTAAEKIL